NELKLHRYDIAVITQKWWRSAMVAKFANIPQRIGFDDAPAKMFYTHTVPYPKDEHEIIRLLELVRPLGIEPEIIAPRIYPEQSHYGAADDFLNSLISNKIVGIAPGSAWKTKRYTKYPQLIRTLKDMNYISICIGNEADNYLCDNIINDADVGSYASKYTSNSILKTSALLSRIPVLVANDSGAGHIASAVGTPVITIYGPTVPEQGFYPWGKKNRIVQISLDCQPCDAHGPNKCPLSHHKCMNDIEINRIVDNIIKIMDDIQ
ncbi:hypothetical protein DRQ33_03415, partial [bacterium]